MRFIRHEIHFPLRPWVMGCAMLVLLILASLVGFFTVSASGLAGRDPAGASRIASQPIPQITFSTVHRFSGSDVDSDGDSAVAGLIRDAQGNLYGTTVYGGSYDDGAVCRITPSGAESILYSFIGPPDGFSPAAALIQDASANLYGTTTEGGAYLLGTVFKISASGVETVLYNFQGQPDGATPTSSLIWGAKWRPLRHNLFRGQRKPGAGRLRDGFQARFFGNRDSVAQLHMRQ
jgi:uncharacterized repeat protein (TIGR03803 family)